MGERGGGLAAARGVGGGFDGVFNRFAGLAGAFLDPAEEFLLEAMDVLEIVIGERGPLLFELAFGDVPIAFDFEFCHDEWRVVVAV